MHFTWSLTRYSFTYVVSEMFCIQLPFQWSSFVSKSNFMYHPAGSAPLEMLPTELLQQIGLCSHNTNLVFVSKTVRAKLSSPFFQMELVRQELHHDHHTEYPPPTSIMYFGDNTSWYASFSEPRPDVSALPQKLVQQARKDHVLAHADSIAELLSRDPQHDAKNVNDFKAWLVREPAHSMPWPMVVTKFPVSPNNPRPLSHLLKIQVGKEWSLLLNGRLQTPRSANDYYRLYTYGAFQDGTTEVQYCEEA